LIETVVAETLRELTENLRAQILGDIAVLVDLAQRSRDLQQLLVEEQEDLSFDRVG